MDDIKDISDTDPGFDKNQHCTYPYHDGERDYSFSHTAQYCGRPQPRRCECAFDYPERTEWLDIAHQVMNDIYMTVPSSNDDLYSRETVLLMLADAAEKGAGRA